MNSAKREFVLTWRIENVSFGERRYISSPEFQAECLGQTRWTVVFCPLGYQNESSCKLFCLNGNSETSNTLELYDISKNKSVGKDVIGYRFELLDINGVLFRSSSIQTFIDEEYYNEYIWLEDIGLERDLKDLPEDIVIIRCVLMRMKDDSSSENFNSCLENQRADEAKSDCECNTIYGVDTFTCTYKDIRTLNGEKVVPTPTRFGVNLLVNKDGGVYVSFYTKKAQDVTYASFKISLICPDGTVAKVLLDTPTQYLELVGYDTFYIGGIDDKYYLKFETKYSNSVRIDKVSYSPDCISNAAEISAHTSEDNKILANAAEAINPEGISISTQTEESNVDFKSQELKKSVYLPLQDDLCKLLTNETFADVKLKSENVIMPAHKALLAARSPVFSAMFHQDMLESQSGTIYLSDVDAETLKLFLKYIYTDTVEMNDHENVIKLMIIADKYQVMPLKEDCSAYLKTMLSDENVCDVIAIADMVNQEDLKLSAMAYIKANVSKILSTSNWKKWLRQNVELAADIVAAVSS